MANAEHLIILGLGVELWNRWRLENSDVYPDLQGATLAFTNLNNANLAHANLRGATLNGAFLAGVSLDNANLANAHLNNANLQEAHLDGANFEGGYFIEADLWGAKLRNANLKKTDFTRADLSETDLAGASLEGAYLYKTNLSGTEVKGATFTHSVMGHTELTNIDLSEAIGLEDVNHEEPSGLGIDTIYLSGSKISDVFLRGCGVPDNFIEYMRSLTGAALEYYSCFISYSRGDQEFASRLHADLQANGVRCWFAPKDLKIGDKLRPSFDQAIRVHDKLMVVLSEHSVQSPWVEKEVETAFEKEREQKQVALFPISLDDTVFETSEAWAADIRRTRKIGDFRGWKNHDSYKKAFDRLLRDLRLGQKPQTEAAHS